MVLLIDLFPFLKHDMSIVVAIASAPYRYLSCKFAGTALEVNS